MLKNELNSLRKAIAANRVKFVSEVGAKKIMKMYRAMTAEKRRYPCPKIVTVADAKKYRRHTSAMCDLVLKASLADAVGNTSNFEPRLHVIVTEAERQMEKKS